MWSVFVDGETDSNARVLTFKETRGMFAKKSFLRRRVFGRAREAETAHSLLRRFNNVRKRRFKGIQARRQQNSHRRNAKNSLQSYAAYCASELGASFGVFGRGGITLKFRNSATEPFSVVNNYKSMAVDLSVENGECPEYDFSDMPDAVVIYLGTNDYLRSLSNNTGYSIAGMEAAYIEFVDKLVGTYYGFDIPV